MQKHMNVLVVNNGPHVGVSEIIGGSCDGCLIAWIHFPAICNATIATYALTYERAVALRDALDEAIEEMYLIEVGEDDDSDDDIDADLN